MPKIPRPRWTHAQIRNKPLAELSKIMGWSERDFEKLKAHIIAAAKIFNLDTFSGPQDQDPAKWEQLLGDCRAKFRELENFEDQWPLEVYYAKYTAWRVFNKNRRGLSTRRTGTQSRGRSGNQRQTGSEKEQSPVDTAHRAQAHANPRSHALGRGEITIASRSAKSTSVAQTTPNASPSAPQNNQGSSLRSKTGSVSANHSNDNFSSSVISRSSGIPHGARGLSPQKSKCGPCILCGAQFPIPSSETTRLRECFNDRPDLLRVLSVVGVIADHHLNAFLHVSSHARHDFLHGGALQGRLTYLEKIEILDLLESYYDSRSSASTSRLNLDRAQKVGLTKITRPPVGLENILADYRAGYTNVMRHMRVTDEEEYFEIVDLIEGQIPRYIDVASPIEDQDDTQLEALIEYAKPPRNAEGESLTFNEFYPNCASKSNLFYLTSHRTQWTTFQPHQCPILRAHPHSRVPPSLAALLADLDMEELGPAFLFLGIRSDDKFASIVTSPRVRAQFVAELSTGAGRSLVGCSDFQRTMLGWVLEQV
ncbi:hypothetical protein C8F04DRAFT_1269873 [Mycena alexandri]|uniref:Uncharacterized protein n=2 Tax=Mycena alexandri TaxID=1745969 RepID=A0AAD6SDS7_9AGAR|nr:hypothetical protein C8F04DRAFT_1269873 [Mycena alexandri]